MLVPSADNARYTAYRPVGSTASWISEKTCTLGSQVSEKNYLLGNR